MLVLRNHGQMRAGCGAATLIIGAALLAGCSSTSNTTEGPSFTTRISSLFSGSRDTATVIAAAPGETSNASYSCPGVEVRRGTGTLNVAAKSSEATAGDLRYQLSIRDTARECLVQGGIMIIRVGVQGRIILGPYGGPGQVDLPVRYAVVMEGMQPRTIITKFKRFSAVVPPGETNVAFTDVEDGLSFPIPSEAELSAYVVYVGFDEIGDKNEKKPKPAKKKKRTP